MGADENVGFIILGVVLVIFLVVIGLTLCIILRRIILRRRRRNLEKVSETWVFNRNWDSYSCQKDSAYKRNWDQYSHGDYVITHIITQCDKKEEDYINTISEKCISGIYSIDPYGVKNANETRGYENLKRKNIHFNYRKQLHRSYIDAITPDNKCFRSIVAGRPTSVLTNPSGIDTYDKGIFCYNTIGPEGGMLEISGVTLKIPKHAIAEPTRFTLGVIWDENLRPKLTNKQALLSPIVICQPSLKFKLPVKLSFPHCAVNVSENWRLKFIKKEGDIGETSDWRSIDGNDYVKIHVTLSHINLELHHFTLYTCVGEGVVDKIAAKSVKLVAFTSRLQIGSPYKARIYCINDYKKEMEDLVEIEKRLEGKMADANVPLFIHDDGGNISVTSSYVSENWNLIGNKTEEMDFELVWHALTPSCTFIFKPGKSTMKEIICEFKSLQVTQKNKIAKLKVADQFEQKIPNARLVPIADDPQGELFRSLSVLLDPKSITDDTGDYRTLAEKVNCDGEEIKWLEQQPNPTEIVLHKYLTHGGKLTDLRQILIDIKRPDAVETLEKYLHAKTECE